jgi:CRISPR system Cascade subunit CasE
VYLTRLQINMASYETMRVMNSQERLHALVEKAIEGQAERGLWRLDTLNGDTYLMLLSGQMPDLRDAQRQIGFANRPAESRDYSPLLARIQQNSTWHFRLTANPTQSIQTEKGERGRVKAVTTAPGQREWLLRQADKHGFALFEDSFDVVQSEWKKFFKAGERGRPVTLLQATFEGVLQVTDAEAFRWALLHGLGRAKAYGMGLLTVVRHG